MIQIRELRATRNMLEEAYDVLWHMNIDEFPQMREMRKQIRATLLLLTQTLLEEEEKYL